MMRILKSLLAWMKSTLVRSDVIHLRQVPARSLDDVVDVIDRFLDRNPHYPLEWDDFVSWESDDMAVEQVRDRIAALEQGFFSPDMSQRERSLEALVEIRNQVARMRDKTARKVPYRDSEH